MRHILCFAHCISHSTHCQALFVLSSSSSTGAEDTIAGNLMAHTSRTTTQTVAAIYALIALLCMALAYLDMKDIYREDINFSHLLGRRAPLYLWQELIFYGLILIAPAALLLFSSIGTFASSASRIRVFLTALAITLPFVMAICVSHPWGGRATLYVAGPIASIMAALAYKHVSYVKIAFWSAAALLASRSFIVYSCLDRGFTPTLVSYMLWGEVEFTCLGCVLFVLLLSAVRVAYVVRAKHAARKTFAA